MPRIQIPVERFGVSFDEFEIEVDSLLGDRDGCRLLVVAGLDRGQVGQRTGEPGLESR
ncbi:hypothetical protein [Streptomyces virginiae]|uniref:hypothetical protein n=1 Tax=Streptomyces virginiae TaxID=1961 RepID=UPI0036E20042